MKGHYFKRGNTWTYIVDLPQDPVTGKRRQKKKGGFKTKKEAQAAATKLLNEIQEETYFEEKDITFKEFAKEWLALYEKTADVKISTIRVRKHELNNLLPFFAKYRLKNITRKMYQDALLQLQNKFSYNTLSGIHITGKMIFKKAVELEIIKKDPTQYVKLPRSQKTVEELENQQIYEKYLEKEELSLFLNCAKTKGLENDYFIFLLLSYTGLRIGELCALKWRDIDFENETISITKTYYNPKNNTKKYTLLPPKTTTSIRTIDIAPIVVAELKKHKAAQDVYRMAHRNTYHDEGFVLAKRSPFSGYPLVPKNIEDRMARLLNITGLSPSLTPHSLRHTHASLLAEAGVSLLEIMERLGHKDDEITKEVYLHVTKGMKKEASQKFNELMSRL